MHLCQPCISEPVTGIASSAITRTYIGVVLLKSWFAVSCVYDPCYAVHRFLSSYGERYPSLRPESRRSH